MQAPLMPSAPRLPAALPVVPPAALPALPPAVPLAVLLAVLLATGFVAALLLGRSALRAWWEQRAGEPYDLPSAYGGAVARAAGAAALAVAVLAGTAAWLLPRPAPAGVRAPHAAAAPSRTPAPVPPSPSPSPSLRPSPPPDAPPRTVGHPEGGTLLALDDGTRVWLPPQYDYPRSAGVAFPTVVAYADTDDPDLLRGFTAHVAAGLADPFVVVLPPHCGAAPRPSRLAGHFRIVPGRSARAVLGVADQAPCALREALAHPGRYQAAVGVSGTYDDTPVPASGTPRRAQLMLGVVSGEERERASALRYRDTARAGEASAEVRVVDGITPRRLLFAMAAGYLTEKLDGPRHPYEGG